MRPHLLVLILFCLTFLPILLTLFSFLSSHRVATPNSFAGRTSVRAFFSLNIPSSLFPPSAIVSLTDDNSTFFLARPAAFGPLLPADGISGQLWVGNGFGVEGGATAGSEGELGCSDIPGWGESNTHHRQDKKKIAGYGNNPSGEHIAAAVGGSAVSRRSDSRPRQGSNKNSVFTPSANDGTDDYLHHPLPESDFNKHGQRNQDRLPVHADIQSIQESAEIAGKVVLLRRGGCGFLEKVKWAQRRGGVALIVGDDSRGGSLVTMYARGDTSNVSIPAIFTSYTTAHLLSSLVPPQMVGPGASPSTGYNPSLTNAASSGVPGKQGLRLGSTATSSAAPTPTPTGNPIGTSNPKPGLLHTLFALLGQGCSGGGNRRPLSSLEDGRPSPGSGNIGWVPMGHWDEQVSSSDDSHIRSKGDSTLRSSGDAVPRPSSADDDGFVIGVHDWRDPDMVTPRSSLLSEPSNTAGKEARPSMGSSESSDSDSTPDGDNDWLLNPFSWSKTAESVTDGQSYPRAQGVSKSGNMPETSSAPSRDRIYQNAHTGLWVTLTPASMSTSPFFDTLLVLVVSPLLTLSVVYALLLLRSRIRRRRWRAPKSVVDRLPIRTYHTITTASSSAASSSRSASPESSSPADPLLGFGNRSDLSRSKPLSRPLSHTSSVTMPGSAKRSKETAPSTGEISGSGSTLWRRKYTGRQVECVVCLEEYVDGRSRVMSLPCGHEFHAECITPWLTTRRRTCPICKGDVVRSMSQHTTTPGLRNGAEQSNDDELLQDPSSAPVPISNLEEDETEDLEQNAGSGVGPLERRASSEPHSTWESIASLSSSIFNGDTIWRQSRGDRNR